MGDTTFSGVRDLGALVGAGSTPAFGSDAYLDGLTGGYQAQDAGYKRDRSREEARISRSIAIAREALPDAVRALYPDQTMGDAAAAILGGNRTASLTQLGPVARPGAYEALQAAIDAATAGNTDVQNRQTALAAGKPYEPFESAAGGDMILNPGTGDYQITDLGRADLVATQARAGASAASGRAADALAGQRNRTTPGGKRATGADAVAEAAGASAPPPGAKQAADGKFYLPDPARPGKWLLWEP